MEGIGMFAGVVRRLFDDVKDHALLAHFQILKDALVYIDDHVLGKRLTHFFSHRLERGSETL